MDEVLPGDDATTFAHAGRLGFAGVEVVLRRDELRSPRRERLERLRSAIDASGLAVPSLVLTEHSQGGLSHAEPEVVQAAEEDVRAAVEWAAALRADAVLVPFFAAGELRTDADLDRAASSFRLLCPDAEAAGVALLYEGTLPADRVRLLAERIGSTAFGCYFDLANPVVRGLDTATEIRGLGDLIRRVHVKDTRARPGDCPPGLGRVDWSESAAALAEIGYDGWLVLETPPGPPPLVARDLSFTRSVFPALRRAPWPRFGAFSYDFAAGEWDRLGTSFGELGLEAVQLGDPLLTECLEDPDAIPAHRARLDEHGLEIAALAGYCNLIAPDEARRRACIERLARCLALAPALETYVVATETGTRHPLGEWTDSPENWGETAWKLLHEALEALVPAAEQAGVVLALEATVKNVLRTQGQLIGLLERFHSPHLQVVCDPYNYLSRGLMPARERHTQELLDRFEHRFAVAHLKDVDAGGAEAGTPELGTGVFPQRPYLEFLRDRRPDLPLIVEHLPLEHVPAAIKRVHAILA
jgi:sugar phosphate isomerase/epimerase